MPKTPDEDVGRSLYMSHGGAFVFAGSLRKCRAGVLADRMGVAVVSVDYRCPPDHPFPLTGGRGGGLPGADRSASTADRDRRQLGRNLAAGRDALMIRDQGLPCQPASCADARVDLTKPGKLRHPQRLLDVV